MKRISMSGAVRNAIALLDEGNIVTSCWTRYIGVPLVLSKKRVSRNAGCPSGPELPSLTQGLKKKKKKKKDFFFFLDLQGANDLWLAGKLILQNINLP